MIAKMNSLDQLTHTLMESGGVISDRLEELTPPGWLDAPIGQITVGDLLMICAVLAGTFLLRWLIVGGLDRALTKLAEKRGSEPAERTTRAVVRVCSYLILMAGIYLLAAVVKYPTKPINIELAVWRTVTSVSLILIGMISFRIVSLTMFYMSRGQSRHDRGLIDRRMLPLFRDMVKVGVFVTLAVLVVQVWGYSATAILAGVGLGGLALAFAAQDSIANVFGSMVIYTDRPFKVGDWIMLADVEGTVEEIGIRSTRVRKFDSTIVSVPNKVIANENVQNLSTVRYRRVRFNLGVRYNTTPGQLRQVRDAIFRLIDDNPDFSSHSIIVRFWQFGESSLDILVRCYTIHTEYEEFARVQEDLLLHIYELLETLGVQIAFPSRSLYLEHPADWAPSETAPDGIVRPRPTPGARPSPETE